MNSDRPASAISWDAYAPANVPVMHADIQGVNALAFRALVVLFDGKTQLFSNRKMQPDEVFVWERVSRRDTVIALLGLRRLDETGADHPFNFRAIEKAVFDDLRWANGVGDLGLLLWYASLHAPERLASLYRHCDLEAALDSSKDAREARTQELSCFLAGLAHAKLAQQEAPCDITDLAVETYQKLIGNQGGDGIFSHRGLQTRLDAWMGGRFGTFTDQAYSIYALAKFARAFGVDESLGAALDCASALCAMQGPLGQWWWMYDARKGMVACQYPVLSVNQAGTAPTALYALQEATGMDFQGPIYKGLRWIFGQNELAKDLRELESSGIWASVTRDFSGAKYFETALSLLGISPNHIPNQDIRMTHERFADRCGWPLYCFGKFGLLPTPMSTPAVVSI